MYILLVLSLILAGSAFADSTCDLAQPSAGEWVVSDGTTFLERFNYPLSSGEPALHEALSYVQNLLASAKDGGCKAITYNSEMPDANGRPIPKVCVIKAKEKGPGWILMRDGREFQRFDGGMWTYAPRADAQMEDAAKAVLQTLQGLGICSAN